ncbi:hypothetical protein [Desulfotignum phosphitoxidans]|uniref:Type I restriction-modification system restriction subunit R n=1 Tax=Desulfotignum phosphitoxidans DSM 13687 TaxID=1286635 RepID=S0G1E4_9BACT|nr:hypothetical protein [Desulfotignum phosphitoxidans]EMS80725.1 type I restriction-modification system restriction subunit R [Desulfotignum phosphitoxidans DSM 13687]
MDTDIKIFRMQSLGILQERIADIFQHFIRLSGRPKDPLNKRRLFFPRYHQMDVVRKLAGHAAQNGVGHTYLIHHSAGSGKSNSITWAAYRLIETYPAAADIRGAKGLERPLFDSKKAQKKLKGKAKAMVITQNIETAIRYFQAISRLLAKRSRPCPG